MVKPLLDVTEVILDPMFADGFSVLRRQQMVNEHGEPFTLLTKTFTETDGCVGVISPSADNSMVRADAYEAMGNSIQVITKFRLRGISKEQGDQYLPDTILWRSCYYVVRTINDFVRYGAGFMVADCLLTDYVPEVDHGS